MFADVLTAVGHRGTDARIADFAIAAVAVVAAFGAVATLAGNAALQPRAALELRIRAGTRLGDAQVSALTQRHTMVSATFFALAAGPVTGAAITEFARPTIPI